MAVKKATKSGREALVKSFLIALAVFLGLAALDLTGNASFFWTHTYYFLIFFLAIAGFVIVVLHALDIKARLPEKHSLRDFYYLFFIPIGLLPFLECPYKVPFLFCRVCPRRCPWGETRALLFPTMLVQNLDNRHWCFNFCPLGRFQDLQSAVVKKRMRVPLFIVKHRNAIRYALLLGAAALVIKSYYGTAGWFFNGS
ncbi:hypothetical protein D6764_00810, partial [Candidatus Woesearchaeota archaeon]